MLLCGADGRILPSAGTNPEEKTDREQRRPVPPSSISRNQGASSHDLTDKLKHVPPRLEQIFARRDEMCGV